MQKSKRNISKPMLAWLGFNGLMLLWFMISVVLRYRLVSWHGKWYSFAIIIGVVLVLFFGWSIMGLLWLLQRSKILCMIASLLPAAVAVFTIAVLLPGMLLGLGMLAYTDWKTDYFTSPEGTNTIVVFWGGDAGATTRGPYYAAYPMVREGVYRYSQGNQTERTGYLEYVPPNIEWLSERVATVHFGIKEISIEF